MSLENLLGPVGDMYWFSNTYRMLVYVNMQVICVGMQVIYVNMQDIYVDMYFLCQNAR